MVKRICPDCGAKYYSSDTREIDWKCEKCGAVIPKSCEKDLDDSDR